VASDTVANQNDKEISQGSKIVEIVDCNKPINELERMEWIWQFKDDNFCTIMAKLY